MNVKCIIQIKDYELGKNNTFEGGIHKDGLFESIKAIGIYYYHIDDDLIGGDLQLHSLVENDDNYDTHGAVMRKYVIKVKQNRIIVFNNYATYHKVTKLWLRKDSISGHRKCVLFFILDIDHYVDLYLDTTLIKTNLQYEMIQLVMIWAKLRNVNDMYSKFNEKYNYHNGYKWLFDIITIYLIGDDHFIQHTKDLFRKSRKVHRYEKFRNNIGAITYKAKNRRFI